MSGFPRPNVHPVDEENLQTDGKTCFPELIDPFSASLAVQIKNYQRQRLKKTHSVGDMPNIEFQERAAQEQKDLESNFPHNRLSLGGREGAAGLCHNCGGVPIRGRGLDNDQFLHPSGWPNVVNNSLERVEASDGTSIRSSGNELGQSRDNVSYISSCTSSATSGSTHSTGENSRPPPNAQEPFSYIVPGGVPSRSFFPQQKEHPPFPFSTHIPPEESIKIRIYVLIVRIILPQIYLHCLLRVPYLYLSRVHEIFQDSTITLKDFENLTLMDGGQPGGNGPMPDFSESSKQSYARMKANWEMFIDGLMREWKTFNIISGLLLSGILSIFQADGANAEPITRYAALCSLVCALISLIYGCFFIIRFGSMRRVSRGVEWAFASCNDQSLTWNVYVLLAMPIIWLIWSIIAFLVSIMAFMWRVRPGHEVLHVSANWDTAFRVFVCLVLGLGMAYAVLIISTLRHYGAEMDKAWNRRMREFWNRRTCCHPPQRRVTPQKASQSKPYVVPPTPTPPNTQASAPERLPAYLASNSTPSQAPTSPTIISPSPTSHQLSPENRYSPMKLSGCHHQPQSPVDDAPPTVIPPTPTETQSPTNSYIDAVSNYVGGPVNQSRPLHAVPSPPPERLPLVPEHTTERIPPSFSRRYEAIASSSSPDSSADSTPISDHPHVHNETQFLAPPAAVITTDPPPEPDIQLVPRVKPTLKSRVDNGDTSPERLPQLAGGNSVLETPVADHMPLSQVPNAHRSKSETNSIFRREQYKPDTSLDGTRKSDSSRKDRPPWLKR